jgi:hypothetical protein
MKVFLHFGKSYEQLCARYFFNFHYNWAEDIILPFLICTICCINMKQKMSFKKRITLFRDSSIIVVSIN